MTGLLRNKPLAIFDHLHDGHVWIVAYNHQGVYGFMAIDIDGRGSAAIHIHPVRWSRDVLQSSLADWKKVKRFLKVNKCTQVVASNPDTEDERWPKFIKYFGFPEPMLVWLSVQEV